MSTNMTPDEYWAHPTTRRETELLQEALRGIANELGQERAALAQLPRLNMILENVRSRLVRLELDVADPPTTLSPQARSAGR